MKAEGITWEDIASKWCEESMRYLIVGREVSKEGYEHYQIYVQLKNQMRMAGLKNLFSCKHMHVENQRGTNEQARNYCWKGQYETKGTDVPQPSASILEFGDFCRGQGHRSDLERIKKAIDDGEEHLDICQEQSKWNSYARYHGWFKEYKQMVDDKKYNEIRKPLSVTVIFGDQATGKTTAVLEQEGLSNCYILKNPNGDNKNWNGYNNQKVLIIDDFYGWLRVNEMLRILDNKPFRVRKLGGYTWAKWDKVYITSNKGPRTWYDICSTEVMDAFYSRLSKCLKVTRGNTGTLVCKQEVLPCRNRNNHKDYLDLSKIVWD